MRTLMPISMKIKVDEWAKMPSRAYADDAGLDLRSPKTVIIPARRSEIIDTGVHVEIPRSCAGILMSKSGLNVIYGITSTGVIDVGYTGSIKVKLYNNSDSDYLVREGDKISQLLIIPVVIPEIEVVGELKKTLRGDNGFGSSGK